jgi:hypothetical protein
MLLNFSPEALRACSKSKLHPANAGYSDTRQRITADEMEGDILVRDARVAAQCYANIATAAEVYANPGATPIFRIWKHWRRVFLR